MDNTPQSKKQNIIDIITEGLTDCEEPLAVTFTLNAKQMRKRYNVDMTLEDGTTQNTICSELLKRLLDSHVKYIVITEFTLDGMWHSHGILFKVSQKFKTEGWSKIKRNLGFVKIKKIDNMKKWIEYITKDRCDHVMYSFDYTPDLKLHTVQYAKIIKLNAKFYKHEAVRDVITAEDYDCYKLKKARDHVMAAAKMFRKSRIIKKAKKKCKRCIII